MHTIETDLLNAQNIPDLVLFHISSLNMKLYSVYREIRETDLDITSSSFEFSKDGTSCMVRSADYINRVRLNSILRIYFGDDVIFGTCEEWDCSRTGKCAYVLFKSTKPNRSFDKVILNRRKEKLMRRLLFRHYVTSIASSNFSPNNFQKHCYLGKSFNMKNTDEVSFKRLVPTSSTLNDLQELAFCRSFHPISVIHGPPGTGKTRTLAAICKQAVQRGEGVLCLCWTNVAIRNLCDHLRNILPPGLLGIRISTEFKCWHEKDCQNLKSVEAKDLEVQVLCMTVSNYLFCTIEGESCNKWSSGMLKNRELMVLDESSQLWEMDAVFLLHRLDGYKRLLLAGDDNQLPPYVAREFENSPSIMTWIRRVSKARGFHVPITLLLTQYRMKPHVGTVVSENFYKGKLQHSKIPDGHPHLFLHSVQGNMETIGTSRFCREQSKRCSRIYSKYQTTLPPFTIQVLTYYEAQCKHIKKEYPKMNVCCVDSYQGQEADVVILLLSLKNCKLNRFILHKGRMCVATSRSRVDLHIVGHFHTMIEDVTWRRILSKCHKVLQ